MAYGIIKLIYILYTLGALYLLIRAASYSIFSGDVLGSRMKFLWKSLLVSIVWPISVFSDAGRNFMKVFLKLN